MRIHIARERETLWELATQYNVPVRRLLEANPKLSEDHSLQEGMKVKIPMGKVPVFQAEPREKRRMDMKPERSKRQKQSEEAEVPLMSSPQVTIDPSVFFLEQGQEASTYHDPPHYPHHGMIPYYMPPPYISYYPSPIYPYPWPPFRPGAPYPTMGYPQQIESEADRE